MSPTAECFFFGLSSSDLPGTSIHFQLAHVLRRENLNTAAAEAGEDRWLAHQREVIENWPGGYRPRHRYHCCFHLLRLLPRWCVRRHHPSLACPGHDILDHVLIEECFGMIKEECTFHVGMYRAYRWASKRAKKEAKMEAGRGAQGLPVCLPSDIGQQKPEETLARIAYQMDAMRSYWLPARPLQPKAKDLGPSPISSESPSGWVWRPPFYSPSVSPPSTGVPPSPTGISHLSTDIPPPSTRPITTSNTFSNFSSAARQGQVTRRCPACIMAYIGGDQANLKALLASLLARMRFQSIRPESLALLPLVQSWIGCLDPDDLSRVERESAEDAEVLKREWEFYGVVPEPDSDFEKEDEARVGSGSSIGFEFWFGTDFWVGAASGAGTEPGRLGFDLGPEFRLGDSELNGLGSGIVDSGLGSESESALVGPGIRLGPKAGSGLRSRS